MEKCYHVKDDFRQEWNGHTWFYAGEVYDNYTPVYICKKCGEVLEQKQFNRVPNARKQSKPI